MNPARNLIITAALNYDPVDLRVFLRSAAQCVPGADVLLFTERHDEPFRAALEADHPRLHLVRPPGIERRQKLWRNPRRRRRICRTPRWRGRFNAALLGTPLWPRASALLHIVMARHFWVAWALRQSRVPGVEKVLVCDCRDILFQADPFVSLDRGLITSGGGQRIAEFSKGFWWMRRHYPEALVRPIADQLMLSAGAILGDVRAILELESAMEREIRRLAPSLYGRNGDQRIFNVLLHALTDLSFTILPAGNPVMAHMFNADLSVFRIDEDGIRTADGRLVALVHHYDCIPSLKHLAMQRYGAGAGIKPDLRTRRR